MGAGATGEATEIGTGTGAVEKGAATEIGTGIAVIGAMTAAVAATSIAEIRLGETGQRTLKRIRIAAMADSTRRATGKEANGTTSPSSVCHVNRTSTRINAAARARARTNTRILRAITFSVIKMTTIF